MTYQDPEKIIEELRQVDRLLMSIKRDAKRRYGGRRANWPAAVLEQIATRKAQAIAYRTELGMRKP